MIEQEKVNKQTKKLTTRTGRVVSNTRNKTIAVLVEMRVKHPIFGKIVKKFKKYHAHDEHNRAKLGDVVTIAETKSISKTKTWVLC